MYDDYDDFEPREENDFHKTIDALIDFEINQRYSADMALAQRNAESIKRISTDYNAMSNKFFELERSLSKQIDEAKNQTRKETLREFTEGFSAGDVVFYRHSKPNYHKCEHCNGTGNIEIPYEQATLKASCPHCRYGRIEDEPTITVKKDIIRYATYGQYFDTREHKLVIQTPKFSLDDRDGELSAVDLYRTKEEAEIGRPKDVE